MISTLLSIIFIYVFILLGYMAKRIFKEDMSTKTLTLMSVYFLQPFVTIWGFSTAKLHSEHVYVPLLYLAIILSLLIPTILIGKLIFTNIKDRAIFSIAGFVGNTGNIGIPLGIALFGEQSVIYTTLINIANVFVVYIIGVYIAKIFDINPLAGVLAGSAALQGGHGNVVSWSPILEADYNVNGAMEIGMIVATFGLIIGGLLGGPSANYLIKKYDLKPDSDENITIGKKYGQSLKIDYNSALVVLLMLAISIGIGIHLHNLLDYLNFTLPLFATCMLGGVIIANVAPLIIPGMKCPANSPTLAIVNDLSLGLFLAMAMMSLKFWEVGDETPFILVSIVIQTVAILLFSVFVIFRVLGKNYAAAVISAGYIGSAMGATPTAMANMAAVTQEHGPSPIAFAVIPILGAFIIQVSNAVVINVMLLYFG